MFIGCQGGDESNNNDLCKRRSGLCQVAWLAPESPPDVLEQHVLAVPEGQRGLDVRRNRLQPVAGGSVGELLGSSAS